MDFLSLPLTHALFGPPQEPTLRVLKNAEPPAAVFALFEADRFNPACMLVKDSEGVPAIGHWMQGPVNVRYDHRNIRPTWTPVAWPSTPDGNWEGVALV